MPSAATQAVSASDNQVATATAAASDAAVAAPPSSSGATEAPLSVAPGDIGLAALTSPALRVHDAATGKAAAVAATVGATTSVASVAGSGTESVDGAVGPDTTGTEDLDDAALDALATSNATPASAADSARSVDGSGSDSVASVAGSDAASTPAAASSAAAAAEAATTAPTAATAAVASSGADPPAAEAQPTSEDGGDASATVPASVASQPSSTGVTDPMGDDATFGVPAESAHTTAQQAADAPDPVDTDEEDADDTTGGSGNDELGKGISSLASFGMLPRTTSFAGSRAGSVKSTSSVGLVTGNMAMLMGSMLRNALPQARQRDPGVDDDDDDDM